LNISEVAIRRSRLFDPLVVAGLHVLKVFWRGGVTSV